MQVLYNFLFMLEIALKKKKKKKKRVMKQFEKRDADT